MEMKKYILLIIATLAVYGSNVWGKSVTITSATDFATLLSTTNTTLSSGDTIIVPEGTWDTNAATLNITSKFLHIIAAPAATTKPIVKFKVLQMEGYNAGVHFKDIEATSTTDYFIDFLNNATPTEANTFYSGTYISLENCTVSGFRRMLFRANRSGVAQTLDSIVLINCDIRNKAYEASAYATFLLGANIAVKKITCQFNTFYSIPGTMFSIAKSAPTTVSVDHNTFFNVVSAAYNLINVSSTSGDLSFKFTNNIVHKLISPGTAKPFSINAACGSVLIDRNVFSSFEGASGNYSSLSTNTSVTLGKNWFYNPAFNPTDTLAYKFVIPDTSILRTAGTDGSPVGDTRWLNVVASSISINESKVAVGEPVTVTINPYYVYSHKVKWAVAINEIGAVIDSVTGRIYATGIGKVMVTATTTDGSNLSVTREVELENILVTGLSIDQSTISAGNALQLTVTFTPSNATNKKIKWIIPAADTTKAEVDSLTGILTAYVPANILQLPDTITLYAYAMDTSKVYAVKQIIIENTPVTKLAFTNTATMIAGSSKKLTVTVTPSNATNKQYVFSVEPADGSMATISNDTVFAGYTIGQFVIKATAADGSGIVASQSISITPNLITAMTISGPQLVVVDTYIGKVATIEPSDATTKMIRWYVDTASSPANFEQYFMLDSMTGSIEGLLSSSEWFYVKAYARDGSGVTARDSFKVAPQLVTGILVTGDTLLLPGNSALYTAVVTPSNATSNAIVWRLRDGDSAIAQIDSVTGYLTALAPGYVVVKALATDTSGIFGQRLVVIKGDDVKNHQAKNYELILYPQPVADILNIRSSADVEKIQIISMTGEIVIDNKCVDYRLNVAYLVPGIYIAKIWIKGDSFPYLKTFVKK
jgi:uncharacterized protein YjdB